MATVSSTQHILYNLLNQTGLIDLEINKHPGFDEGVKLKFEKMKKEAKKLVEQLASVADIDEEEIKKSIYPK